MAEDVVVETTKRRGRPPKTIENTQPQKVKRKSSREPDEATAKAKAKSEKAEVSIVKAIKVLKAEEEKAEEKAERAKARQNKKEADIAAEAGEAASSSTRKEHGVGLIENRNPSYWKKQNITVIKSQAELRGHRFTDLETKGGGVKSKFKQIKKNDYLDVLFKILKI